MVVAEVLTGIALVQQSVKFIKENISTAQDISSLASSIDDLFRGEKETQQARAKKSGTGLSDQFGVESVAAETINAKLAAERLYEISQMIDLRFGHGTWASILAERAKRIAEAKEAEAVARREKIKRANEMEETIKIALGVFLLIAAVVGLFVYLMFSVVMAVQIDHGRTVS